MLIWRIMASGEVERLTPTKGLEVSAFAKEMSQDCMARCAAKADQVKPRLMAAAKCVAEPAAQIADVGPVHDAGPLRFCSECEARAALQKR